MSRSRSNGVALQESLGRGLQRLLLVLALERDVVLLEEHLEDVIGDLGDCLLYTSPSPRD